LEAFRESKRLGEVKVRSDGSWDFVWEGVAPSIYNVVALAEDSESLVACSNVVRVTVGLKNLARGAKATASSTRGEPPEAVIDGDPHTMWGSDNNQPDPQWLAVDLGKECSVGAVSVLWWKAYASDYIVEVSSDARSWHEVARVSGRNKYHGDTDVLYFKPVNVRYVRLYCIKRAVTWGAYAVFELGIWERLPEH